MDNEILNQLKDTEIPDCDLEKLVEEGLKENEILSLSILDDKVFALKLIETCSEYIGVSRSSNLNQVARFLKLFGLPTKLNGKWVPFCAAGLSFSACKTYCDLCGIKYNSDNALGIFKTVLLRIKNEYFKPSPRCWEIKETAENQKRYLINNSQNRKLVKPGYLVLFNFDKDSLPDHIGIVTAIDQDSVKTIEFNTSSADDINGGAVTRRDRPFNKIQGFVKLY